MLRNLLLIVALLVTALGAVAWLTGHRDAAPAVIAGSGIAVAVLLERWRYRTRQAVDDAGWERTDERFIDPESGQAMQVLYNPRTGERRYEPANGHG